MNWVSFLWVSLSEQEPYCLGSIMQRCLKRAAVPPDVWKLVTYSLVAFDKDPILLLYTPADMRSFCSHGGHCSARLAPWRLRDKASHGVQPTLLVDPVFRHLATPKCAGGRHQEKFGGDL